MSDPLSFLVEFVLFAPFSLPYEILWPSPLATSVEISGGSLGVKGWAAETRATVGAVVGFAEFYGGWDAVWVGAPRERTVSLGGPTTGVRAYF